MDAMADAGLMNSVWAVASMPTSNSRLVITILTVITTLFISGIVLPILSRVIADGIKQIPGRNEESVVDALQQYAPGWLVSSTLYLRIGQISTVILSAFTLLVIWGRLGLVMGTTNIFVGYLAEVARAILTILLAISTYIAMQFIDDWVRQFSKNSSRVSQHQEEIAARGFQLGVFVIAGSLALIIWQVNIGNLLVGAGFLGIVVGLAARQTLGALLAGIVLMFSRPFEIGDWVEIENNEGIVMGITIVNTRIKNLDGESVVLPNDFVANSIVINRTREGRLRLTLDVGVDYDTDIEFAEEKAEEAIRDVDSVLTAPSPQVVPTEFGASSIDLELRFWIDRPSSRRRWRTRAKVMRNVQNTFRENDIKIPFPQREVMTRPPGDGAQKRKKPDGGEHVGDEDGFSEQE